MKLRPVPRPDDDVRQPLEVPLAPVGTERLARMLDTRPLAGDLCGRPLALQLLHARRERVESIASGQRRFFRVWVPLGTLALLALEYLLAGGAR